MTGLIEKLSEFGTVEICTTKEVFSLLMTGDNLDNMQTALSIQKLVNEAVGETYPNVENMRNKDFFYCIILSKPVANEETIKAFAQQITIQKTLEKKVELLKKLVWRR